MKSIHENLHFTKGPLVMSNIVMPVVKFPQDCDTIDNVLTGRHNLRIQTSTTARLLRVSAAKNKKKSKIHSFASGNFRWFGFCLLIIFQDWSIIRNGCGYATPYLWEGEVWYCCRSLWSSIRSWSHCWNCGRRLEHLTLEGTRRTWSPALSHWLTWQRPNMLLPFGR